jgi:hypothetical protein
VIIPALPASVTLGLVWETCGAHAAFAMGSFYGHAGIFYARSDAPEADEMNEPAHGKGRAVPPYAGDQGRKSLKVCF